MTISDLTTHWPVLLVFGLVAVASNFATMLFRMSQPIPDADAAAIARRFDGQHVASIEKLWFGGPWRLRSRSLTPYQAGRPYRVVLEGDSGADPRPRIVADGLDVRGDVRLIEPGPGGWKVVSHVRPALETLVLSG